MAKIAAAKPVDVKKPAMNLEVSSEIKQGTNINEIEVPPELRITHKSGLEYWDQAMGGEGMTPSASILFTGGPGAGKTTMMLQLANACMGNPDLIALFNTNEEAAVQVRKTVERLKLANGFIIGQDRLVPKVLEHCDYLTKKYKKRILLILDSLQTMDDGYYGNGGTNGNTQIRVTEMITNWCKKTFGIGILIGQVTKSGEFGGKMQVKHTVDAHAHLYIDDQKKSETYGERIFEVQKNRYGCNGISYILGMDKHKGLYEKSNFGGLT